MFIKPLHVSSGIGQSEVIRPAYDDRVQAVADLFQ
jgi:hypothetical protein